LQWNLHGPHQASGALRIRPPIGTPVADSSVESKLKFGQSLLYNALLAAVWIFQKQSKIVDQKHTLLTEAVPDRHTLGFRPNGRTPGSR
jgi:hypothetical protein